MLYSVQQRRIDGDSVQEEYYTVKEVADRLKVTRQAVYDWIRDGRLRAVKVGRRTRVPGSAVTEFLQPIQPGDQIETDDDE
jgi:excisionase family DNA binding protein